MSIFLVLDILLALLIILFMPIGYWRGPVKELFVTLGVLFGILLADFWARPWGRDLTLYTDLTASSGAFIVAMAFLVAATFILGYGLGATLAPAYSSLPTRLIGAAIAALNGALLLSFSLQYVRLFLLSDANEESLDDSFLSQFLLDQIGWLLLFASFVAVPLLLFILISGRRAYEAEYDDEYDYMDEDGPPTYERARVADARTTTLPPRAAGSPSDQPTTTVYKADPEPRRRPATAETRPLIVSEPEATAEPSRPRQLDQPSRTIAAPAAATPREDVDERSARMGDTDPHIVLPEDGDEGQVAPPAPRSRRARPDPAENLPEGYVRCANCHAVLAPDVTICPNCGTLR